MKGGVEATRRLLIAGGLIASVVIGYLIGTFAGGGTDGAFVQAPTAVVAPAATGAPAPNAVASPSPAWSS